MEEIILTGKEIKEITGAHFVLDDNKEYYFKQNDRSSEARPVPTPEEQAIQDYESEKAKALSDIRAIKDEIELGMKTEADLQARQAEWLAYHEANNPY